MTPQHQIPPLRRRAAGAGFLLLLLFVWHRGQGAAGEAPGPLADRLEGVRFREVAHELGIRFTHEATRVDERIAHVAAHVTAVGAGVSVTDADADGWPDLYAVTSAHGPATRSSSTGAGRPSRTSPPRRGWRSRSRPWR